MTQYRLLERLERGDEWSADGVVYLKGNICLFYRHGQTIRLPVAIAALGPEQFPYEEDATFRWAAVQEWDDSDRAFEPEGVLDAAASHSTPVRSTRSYLTIDELPAEAKQAILDLLKGIRSIEMQEDALFERFKSQFIGICDSGFPPYPELVELLWKRWAYVDSSVPLFARARYNVALLLHARAFGLPVDEYPAQVEYLISHKDMYAPLAPSLREWGARASLTPGILTMLDSPVVHVFVHKNEDIPQRIIIVGRGLEAIREKLYVDALVTAMRVQASDSDLLNDGLIVIEQKSSADETLSFAAPVWGAHAPLAESETAEAAMRELIRQLRELELQTGFVQVHESEIAPSTRLLALIRQLTTQAMSAATPLVWRPEPAAGGQNDEIVALQPIYSLSRPRRDREARPSRRQRAELFTLRASPYLLRSDAWRRLSDAYQRHIVDRIQVDAQIRLDYYKQQAVALREEKEQWDKADEQMHAERWGPTVTLNQRFDHGTGLTIWLQPPDIMPTKEYFEANVPGLIHSYEEWARKMQTVLESLTNATKRTDAPFLRLTLSRFFDLALRGRPLENVPPKIQKLYQDWAGPISELLRFEWRAKIESAGVHVQDVFTAHTTFHLFQLATDDETAIKMLQMIPYSLVDGKRSVILFDPGRRVLVVNDASDYPTPAPPASSTTNLQDWVKQQANTDAHQVADQLRAMLLKDPAEYSRQILHLLGPQIPESELRAEAEQIRRLRDDSLLRTAFPRQLSIARRAMFNRALITARENLDAAQQALGGLEKEWQKMQQQDPEVRRKHLRELHARLHLLRAIAECLARDILVKDYLPKCYRSSPLERQPEIGEALAAADTDDPAFTSQWIDSLAKWDLSILFQRLVRELPSERELTTAEQHSVLRVQDAMALIGTTSTLAAAMENLSSEQETRASALVKLGPALESAILSPEADIVGGDLRWFMEVLTGRQVGFGHEGMGI